MHIEGNLLDMRIILGIFNGLPKTGAIELVYGHIDAQILASRLSDVLLKSSPRALASDFLVISPYSVHTHPDAVGPGSGKRLLSVGRYGAGEETYAASKVAKVVYSLVAISPDEGFAALKVHETRAQRVAVAQLFGYLAKGLVDWSSVVVDAAVFAAKVAPVGYEYDALQRCSTAKEGTEPIEWEVEEFHNIIRIIATIERIAEVPVTVFIAVNQRIRYQWRGAASGRSKYGKRPRNHLG